MFSLSCIIRHPNVFDHSGDHFKYLIKIIGGTLCHMCLILSVSPGAGACWCVILETILDANYPRKVSGDVKSNNLLKQEHPQMKFVI